MRIIICSIIFIFLILTPLYANDTSEIIFTEFYNIINNPKIDTVEIAIDYSVEILKISPNSLEAFYTMALIGRLANKNSTLIKFKELKDKYYSDLDNIKLNLPEKIILMEMIFMRIDNNSEEIFNEEYEKCKETLIKIKDECDDKNYSAISTMILLSDKDERDKMQEYFLKTFPEHKAIPLIKLIITSNYFVKKEYEKCIMESNDLIKEYEKVVSPFGWRLVMDYYNLIIFCCVASNDFEGAQKYYNIIEHEAPNYDNLKQLRQILKK